MRKLTTIASACAAVFLTASAVQAEAAFNRIAAFATTNNMIAGEDQSQETSPEIIYATKDGNTLVYTDSPLGAIGFVDITDAANPKPLGNLMLDGEPTAVVVGSKLAYAGVNTSESYVKPSGYLLSLNVADQQEVARCAISGQPDSVAIDPEERFVAIAIENERDEDLNDGVLPQLPAGNLTIVPLADGVADCDNKIEVDLTGLAEIGATDPEPEFVDVNSLGEIVVTLQENNHIVVVSKTGEILSHFSAGAVDLHGIDTGEERAFSFDQTQEQRKREPDSVNWIDDEHFATANEGDYEGGSRGWTIFKKDGTVVYESGIDFEKAIIEIGHYPEKRSGNKGVEPESIEVAKFGDKTLIFVGAERSSIVGVYDFNGGEPKLLQLLPSGIGPEGIIAIPQRDLLVTANEVDLREDKGPAAHVMLYQLGDQAAQYPMITSAGADELIGWNALSGLVADPEVDGKLYAVNDSFMRSQPRIFSIDASEHPARITGYVDVTRDGFPAQKMDMEGITTDGNGGFWVASEGRTDRLTPHAIYQINAKGKIKQEIAFPAALLAVEKRFSAEGITRVGDTLWIAIQREWQDDPKGMVKLVSYNTEEKTWGAVHYPLDVAEKGWVGLSEITAHDGKLYIMERDNQIGAAAKIKRVYQVELEGLTPAELGGELPVVEKTLARDLLPDMQQLNGYVQDKVEGMAIDSTGKAYFITDNDGVDDHSGETLFWTVDSLQ